MKILSSITDNEDITSKTYVDTGLSTKQDTLVSGTNIKTINNQSLLGSGNISISGGNSEKIGVVEDGVWYTYQNANTLDGISMEIYDMTTTLPSFANTLLSVDYTYGPDYDGVRDNCRTFLDNIVIPTANIPAQTGLQEYDPIKVDIIGKGTVELYFSWLGYDNKYKATEIRAYNEKGTLDAEYEYDSSLDDMVYYFNYYFNNSKTSLDYNSEDNAWYSLVGLQSLKDLTISIDEDNYFLSSVIYEMGALSPDSATLEAYLEAMLSLDFEFPRSSYTPTDYHDLENVYVCYPGRIAVCFEVWTSGNIKSIKVTTYGENGTPCIYTATMEEQEYVDPEGIEEPETTYTLSIDVIYKGQEKLVSGTNIKTINNQSLLGSGNIEISGGGGGTWGSITGTLSDQTDLNNALSGKQSTIDSSHKLSADLVDDTSTTNKFVTASDKTTWNAKYSKPSGGIPSTDLSSAVQTSLGKADTALQSETYTGTITSVKMNGTTVSTSGEADLGTVITSHQDISNKQDKIDSSHKLSSDLVDDTNQTNKFVTTSDKTTWSGKQDALVSGTNIKTINNQSLLGSGNISISGGTPTDVQVNGTSIVNNNVANILTQTAYNSSSNKIATMSDVPSVSDRLKIYPRSGYNLNTCYDAGVYLVAQGSNIPSGSNYGSLLTMPYRKADGNTTPDFGTQIFMPNGDDNTHPNSFYYRTALSGSWNNWQELETTTNKVTSISSSSTDAQYPSAKCVYDIVGDIESLLGGI